MELKLSLNQKYSYADYLTWIDDVRKELYNGIVKLMSPAPAYMHQKISMRISNEFYNYLKKKQCQVFHAPFDVRLPKQGETEDAKIFTVVQPDICIVCDRAKLDARGCLGAPDLIVEIVSPGSVGRDIKEKFQIYEEARVLEYWIVRPEEQSVTVFLLGADGRYGSVVSYVNGDKIPVSIFKNELVVDLTDIFED